MRVPTFFISSTIYDFRDLRSSLKFHLEEQGFKVLASEFNDFQKPLDVHSYEACLQAIRSADYFILLIGARVGGWYSEPDQISITQREYREAYKLHQEGKLKLLSFVRADVWQAKEDRRELVKFLDSIELDDGLRSAIANHKGKSAENAKFLMKFLSEVGKNKETSLASKGSGKSPTGNWIHAFSSFREIADVLDAQSFASVPIDDMVAKRLLRRELRDILGNCLIKFGEKQVFSPISTVLEFHRVNPLSLKSRENLRTLVNTKMWDSVSSVSMSLLNRNLSLTVLPQVLAKSTFLEFDLTSNSFCETPVQCALIKLQSEIRRFNHGNTSETLSIVYKYTPRARGVVGESIQIETIPLVCFLHLLDRWVNITVLCSSLLKHLDGQDFVMPILQGDSPIKGMQEMLEEETPSDADIDSYLADYK
jgi:hypothetical protein